MNVLEEVRKELKLNIDKKYRGDVQRYFKEKVVYYGVRTPVVRKIAKKHFKEIKHLSKKELFSLCEKLFKSNYNEESIVARQWLSLSGNGFEERDFRIFEIWLGKYMNNWGKVDDFCLHVIHPLIEKYPELIPRVKAWSSSKNMWMRRASAVSFITTYGAFYATDKNLDDVFETARNLLKDRKDLVQKGYGWMLKAASVRHRKEVFDFVMRHKKDMPRTALRYAIEKMPEKMRKKAMKT